MAILEKLRAPYPVRTTKEKAGYYLCTYKGAYEKSYSWTQIREPKQALKTVRQKSWEVSIRKLGIRPPAQISAQIDEIPNMNIPGLNREGEIY